MTEKIDRLAALIPPPRLHRHRYHGVLAPNSPLRAQLVALARQPPPPIPNAAASHAPARSPAPIVWAVLLARIYQILPLHCGLCGADMRIIAFITHAPARHSILTSLAKPTTPPEVAPARGPRCGSRRPSPWPSGSTPRHPCPSSCSTNA